jgi:pectate lyase
MLCAGGISAKTAAQPAEAPLSVNDVPDGFASLNGGTTGGKSASEKHVYKVSNRAEFLNALNAGGWSTSDTDKIIYVTGMIDLSVDDNGKPVDGYWYLSQVGYGSAYATWKEWRDAYVATCSGSSDGSGAPEKARKDAYNLEKKRVVMNIGSNTTIIGSGNGAGFKNGSFIISKAKNVIIRNVSILNAYDWFGSWDASDGNVNSELDGISIVNGSKNVWVDHCTLSDGDHQDSESDYVMIGGTKHKWVVHDGLLDVTKGSDYVTISYNKIADHNKTMLFGASDSASSTDSGKLHITVHHNWFQNAVQRLPRVRFGSVHVYGNYYQNCGTCVGIGDGARIYSENNFFEACKTPFAKYDHSKNKGYVYDSGSSVSPGSGMHSDAGLVGWKPEYAYTADPAASVPAVCKARAGAGRSLKSVK